MRIGLLLQRATDLKWAGPLAEEALKRGYAVSLLAFRADDEDLDAKQYLQIDQAQCRGLIEQGASFSLVIASQIDQSDLLPSLDAVFMQEGFHSQQSYLPQWQALRERGVKLLSLSHFFEICKRPLSALDAFDATVYTSDYARDLHGGLQPSPGLHHLAEQPALGSPMFDQLNRASREASRQALGLKSDERVVLLLAPVILPTTPWRFRVWRDASKAGRLKEALRNGELAFLPEIALGYTFKDVFLAIRAFCDRHQAKLIVKSRGKQKNLEFVDQHADLFMDGYDDVYYPLFSTYQLMAAADLCITVNSMAALEAASISIPVVNIYVPYHDRAAASSPDKEAYNRELLGGLPGTILNYPGAVRKVDRRRAVSYFKRDWPAVSFQPSTTAEYAHKFLGVQPESASARILDSIEVGA